MRHPMFTHEDGNGFRVLLEQASHEIHRGAYDIGLQYLNRALTVRGFGKFAYQSYHLTFSLPRRGPSLQTPVHTSNLKFIHS